MTACPTCVLFDAPGWLPVTVEAHTQHNPYDEPVTAWRPCHTCRRDRYEAWRSGRLRAKPNAKETTT